MRISSLASLVLLVALAACSRNSSPSAPTAGELKLGVDTEVTEGKTYRVGDVAVTVGEIAMASGQDPAGNDTHWIRMKLRVERPAGQGSDLELVGDEPGEAAGLVFRADALGFQWGATPATATLRVERR
jgi:hypothetical protein